jgi:hypothetical protein
MVSNWFQTSMTEHQVFETLITHHYWCAAGMWYYHLWDLLDLLSDSPTLRALAINGAKPKMSKKMNLWEPKVFQVSDIQF